MVATQNSCFKWRTAISTASEALQCPRRLCNAFSKVIESSNPPVSLVPSMVATQNSRCKWRTAASEASEAVATHFQNLLTSRIALQRRFCVATESEDATLIFHYATTFLATLIEKRDKTPIMSLGLARGTRRRGGVRWRPCSQSGDYR